MAIIIGPGIQIGPGISLGPTNSYVTDGLTMFVDASNATSYPGTGSTWYDISGSGNNVTLVGSPPYTPSYFSFDGSTQYGTGSGTPLGISAYTKSMWVNFNDFSTNLNNTLSSDVGGHFMYTAGTPYMYSGHTDWGDFQAYQSNTAFTAGIWYHICLTFDTTNGMTLYVNGTLDSTYNGILTPLPGNGQCDIAVFSGGYNLYGLFGQGLCYNRAITSVEVAQNFAASRSIYGI